MLLSTKSKKGKAGMFTLWNTTYNNRYKHKQSTTTRHSADYLTNMMLNKENHKSTIFMSPFI